MPYPNMSSANPVRRERVALTALRAFEAAARNLSIRKAAAELSVTPGAVSQQVLLLERSLGLQLFFRTGKRLELTEEGSRFALRLAAAFDQIDNALREAGAYAAPGILRLRIAPTLAARWLMPRLANFTGLHPELNVELSTTVTQGNDPTLESVDFAIRLLDDATEAEGKLFLFQDELCPVCIPSVAARLKTMGDLAELPLLHSMMRPECWSIWANNAGCSVSVTRGLRFATAELAYQAAAQGVGIAIAQLAYVKPELQDGRFVTPLPYVARSHLSFYLVNEPHKQEWPKVKLFRDWMASQVRASGPR